MLRFVSSLAIAASLSAGVFAQGWQCYGGNAQHSGNFVGISQSAGVIKWQAPLDDNRAYYGGEVLAHYAAPMVTPSNTVVYGYRFTTTVAGNPDYDNWSVMARSSSSGSVVWQMITDYSAALIYPNDWTTVFPITLFQTSASSKVRGVAAAAGAGSIMVRPNADAVNSTSTRLVFYTTLADFNKNEAAYAPIKINTPLTADLSGNLYFGYEVTGSVPSNVSAKLGSGGIVKINAVTGAPTFVSVQSLTFDSSLNAPAMNAAPALTVDQNYIYVALTGGNPWLVKLATKNLSEVAHAQLFDPSIPGANSILINESSASPMIGPDGHVFMGVFGNQWRESHGWMLQFDGNLNQMTSNNTRLPVGAFGWDDTAVVVPSKIVPSYTGKASYLILTKYNNYDDAASDPGADGSNHLAVLDPTSDSISTDRQSSIPVMNEILLVLGPTKTNDDPAHPNAVNEWCINSAAIDVNRKAAIINSEDGHMYVWRFVTNTLIESLDLAPATGEAYTETAIGPDGQLYVINNTLLFAIGCNRATGVSVVQGSAGLGSIEDLWYVDNSMYATESVSTTAGQSALIEADFTLSSALPSVLSVSSYVSAAKGAVGTVYAYNYTTKNFVNIGTQALSATTGPLSASVTVNASQFVGPGGKVRIRLGAVLPPSVSSTPFKFATDSATCGAS